METTLEEILKMIDWLEINPSPEGYQNLRLKIRQLQVPPEGALFATRYQREIEGQ